MNKAFEAFDEHLLELARFVEEAESMEKGLHQLTVLVGHAMDCRHCSIMLVKQDPETGEPRLRVEAHQGVLVPQAYGESQRFGTGIAGQVAASGKGLLINDLHHSEFAGDARRCHEVEAVDVIAVPVVLDGEVIGVINIDSPRDQRRLTQEDLRMASILALVVAKSVLVHRLKGLLRTSFTQMALARQPGAATGPITHAPERVARLLARTLYDEMSRAGFSRDHVLTAATELIGQVSEGRE
ncbi:MULTISPECIES: GAF domain-containing protein [unclassified Thioalkalivibrio]|uniref:GAF domain-containing protein n=1 Tax=unclassified Thioalkalivibrio TaxID=2621013 RepID=UPI00035E763C|nr:MULTISPECIES: GAF domain-containing protein [unclassified Thioalkalivibrio]